MSLHEYTMGDKDKPLYNLDEPKITQYYIASGPTKEMLGVRVSNRIKQGWTPLGGVSVNTDGRMFQAMVKYE